MKEFFMYTKVINVKEAKDLTIQLPDDYLNEKIKISVEKLMNDGEREKNLEEARAFFRSIAVDMSDFKFDRDEANSR